MLQILSLFSENLVILKVEINCSNSTIVAMELNRKKSSILLKISAILWVIWDIVHALAGVLTISGDTATAVSGIADGVDPALLAMKYPNAVGAIINQHDFNLLWGGVVTIIGGIFIWRRSIAAIFISALMGGLLDIGYFIFVDLVDDNNFVPGTVMTIISAFAIILSF
ncbi:MAG: hypothetical protein AAGE59_30870 [Cyanobacteria bacterium P01_F01_bin.86]